MANRRLGHKGGSSYKGSRPAASAAGHGGRAGKDAGRGGIVGAAGAPLGSSRSAGKAAASGGGGAWGSSRAQRRAEKAARTVPSGRARPAAQGSEGKRIALPNGSEVLLTRRHFLFGALGLGVLAAAGGGVSVLVGQAHKDPDDELSVLKVSNDAVTTSDSDAFEGSFTLAQDPASLINATSSIELPYGTLVWANDDKLAACLLPTETAKPLTQVALLSLGSGTSTTVIKEAVGMKEGFDVYDVRATSSGVVWTEANILDDVWRVYAASLDGMNIGAPTLVDEGDADWEAPTIAAVGGRAFWQVLPQLHGDKKTEPSLLKRATMGKDDVETVYTSHGRMATAPYAMADSVVITPRTDTASIHYQLTRIDADTGDVMDSLALPASMKPLEAGYGDTGFSFSFDASYNFGGGIANLGTYTPQTAVTDGNYSKAPWFCFSRNPTAAPAWCGPFFMVKSNNSVVGIDFKSKEYFRLDAKSGADSYGEYLASTGSHSTTVTFANINDKPLGGKAKKYCLVRTWSAPA